MDTPQPDRATTPEYDAASIRVLRGLDAIRANPGMYVGSTDEAGLRQILFELIYNALDEASSGFCTAIRVRFHEDRSWSVEDDGRGIPVEVHPVEGVPACELVLTTLHAGGKFTRAVYSRSAGMHGLGLSCVNALSSWLELEVRRGGRRYVQRYDGGRALAPVRDVGPSETSGTRIRFSPDRAVFDSADIARGVVRNRLEELAFLLPGLDLEFHDQRASTTSTFRYDGGIPEFVGQLTAALPTVGEPIVIAGEAPGLVVQIVLQWTEGYAEQLRTFVNRVRTPQGGTHVDGLRDGVTRAVRDYADTAGLLDGQAREDLTSYDIWEGLTCVMAVDMEHPEFDGQIKERLANAAAFDQIAGIVASGLREQFRDQPRLAQLVVKRALAANTIRLAARRAKDDVRIEVSETRISEEVYTQQFGIRSRNWHESCSWLTDPGLLQHHADLYDVPKGARMLDVCCGSGVVGASFDGLVGEKIGLDLTPQMVELAGERLDRVVRGNVYSLPFADGEFDLVVNREVLHLLPRCERAVAEIFRVLRPGGQFIVGQIVPFSDVDAYWMFRVFKKKQPLLYNMFLEQEFRELLTGAGFEQLRSSEYLLWESIDLWIDTHETSPLHRHEIRDLFHNAPAEVRAVHPFEIRTNGEIYDCWRWCIYSVKKPG